MPTMPDSDSESDLYSASPPGSQCADEARRVCTVCFNFKRFMANDLSEYILKHSSGAYSADPNLRRTLVVKIQLYELWESARMGDCPYCTFTFDCLRTLDLDPRDGPETVHIFSLAGFPVYMSWVWPSGDRDSVEVYAENSSVHDIPGLGSATEMAHSVLSDSVFSEVRQWIDECVKSHTLCANASLNTTQNMPHRLLDLGVPTPPRGERKIRLVEDLGRPVKYIALSHCWGTSQTFTTKKATIAQRLQEIRWNDLPKTYRDAIKVARRLHVRYIWIDSLCIIQDNLEDWDVESSKMMSIYEGSYVTLAAALAGSDDEGFLFAEEARELYKSKPVSGRSGVRIRAVHDYRALPCEEVLASRAWTLQESLLPVRLVSFSLGVRFQCREKSWCECGSGLYPDPFLGGLEVWNQVDRTVFQDCLGGDLDRTQVYSFWTEGLVVPYNSRAITKHTDRLPAISALATKFQLLMGDDDAYLAGIWRGDLVRGMSWRSEPKSGEWNRDMSDRAPSWSWASVEGPLMGSQLPRHRAWPNFRARFLEWTIMPKGLNATGELDKGTMLICGPSICGFLGIQVASSGSRGGGGSGSTADRESISFELVVVKGVDDGHPVQNFHVRLDSPVSEIEVLLPSGETVGSLCRSPLPAQEPTGGLVMFLMLYQVWVGEGQQQLERVFLMLGNKASTEGEAYQRLGICHFYSTMDDPRWFGELPESTLLVE